MPRIAGVDLPTHKRSEVALTAIFGIGRARAQEILARAGVDVNVHPDAWSDEQTRVLRRMIEDEYVVEGPLRTETQLNIKRLMDIGSVSYTHLRAHETSEHLVCRLLLEKKPRRPCP